jgi:transcriptional regulator with XRE-family HTH domain
MKLGSVVRHLREQRGWSQDELAFRTHTSAANISRIETGKHWPGTDLLKSLAEALELKVYQLIALAEGVRLKSQGTKYDHEEEIVIKLFRAMTKEQQELFKAVGATFAKVRNRTISGT